jgi:hypothetical protein
VEAGAAPASTLYPLLIFRKENARMRRLIALVAAATTIVALSLVQAGAAGPGASLGNYFFGPKLVRAEVVTNEAGTIHDYRVDRGKIQVIARASLTLTLLERDGTLVTVPVTSTANITLNGVTVPFSRLRRGLTATTVRDGAASASIVQATRS